MAAPTIQDDLRSSPFVGMGLSPYYNVAGCAYVRGETLRAAADRIDELDRKVATLEAYLDRGGRVSASGLPLTVRR